MQGTEDQKIKSQMTICSKLKQRSTLQFLHKDINLHRVWSKSIMLFPWLLLNCRNRCWLFFLLLWRATSPPFIIIICYSISNGEQNVNNKLLIYFLAVLSSSKSQQIHYKRPETTTLYCISSLENISFRLLPIGRRFSGTLKLMLQITCDRSNFGIF